MVLFTGYRTDLLFIISSCTALVNVALNFLLLFLLSDVLMAAIATVVSYFMICNGVSICEQCRKVIHRFQRVI